MSDVDNLKEAGIKAGFSLLKDLNGEQEKSLHFIYKTYTNSVSISDSIDKKSSILMKLLFLENLIPPLDNEERKIKYINQGKVWIQNLEEELDIN